MTHISSTTAQTPNNNTSTSLSVSDPSGVLTGHCLIVDIAVRGQAATTNDPTITGPAGWTKAGEWWETGTPGVRLETWYRFVQGGDGTSRSWSWSPTTNAVAVISAHSGLAATPIPASEGVWSGKSDSNTARVTGALTTTGNRILRSVFTDRNGSTYSGAADTQRGTVTLSADASIYVQETATEVSAVTGATRSATATGSTSVAAMAFYALEPGGPVAKSDADTVAGTDTSTLSKPGSIFIQREPQ